MSGACSLPVTEAPTPSRTRTSHQEIKSVGRASLGVSMKIFQPGPNGYPKPSFSHFDLRASSRNNVSPCVTMSDDRFSLGLLVKRTRALEARPLNAHSHLGSRMNVRRETKHRSPQDNEGVAANHTRTFRTPTNLAENKSLFPSLTGSWPRAVLHSIASKAPFSTSAYMRIIHTHIYSSTGRACRHPPRTLQETDHIRPVD
ncbi:hypothetical protein SCHPADRAFT_620388 [Schizopora paradoxa]|uniref:Uncharacterized protein n=1 Tax=Schizopora paradoxa TaxID=27342 RepID=A0A0H2RF02_9AGAM|nr:hypothetical protein SCHPADRAFT_620388 [Schizopora paradoxa]